MSMDSEIRRMKVLEEFIKFKPPFFEGRSDPFAAESWLKMVNMMFNSIGVPRKYRVRFATYLFDGPAEEWWDLRSIDGKVERSWKTFMTVFRNAYILGSPDQDMVSQFRKLSQTDDTSVEEYHSQFSAVCRYDPFTEADPAAKCLRFRDGLRSKIRKKLIPFTITDFDALVDVALRVEADQSGSSDSSGSDPLPRQLDGMTVAKYRSAFVEQYRPSDPVTVANRVWMCIRFKNGLSREIRSMLKFVKLRDFNALVKAARRAEAAIAQRNKGKKNAKDLKKSKMKEKQKKKQQRRDRSSSHKPSKYRVTEKVLKLQRFTGIRKTGL